MANCQPLLLGLALTPPRPDAEAASAAYLEMLANLTPTPKPPHVGTDWGDSQNDAAE